MSSKAINLTIENGLARMALADKDNNAVDLQFVKEFAEAARICNADPSVKAVLLQGRGNVFGMGGDLKEFLAQRSRIKAHLFDMTAYFHMGIGHLRNGPAPLIVAVNGTAAGGSFSLVCAADIAIAKRSAKFNPAYTRSGLSPDGGGTWFLPRIVGVQKAFDIFATNPTLTADQARDLGIVSRVVDDADYDAEVEKLAQQIVNMPAGTMATLKRLMRISATNSLEEHFLAEGEGIATLGSSAATLERLTAFVEKKK